MPFGIGYGPKARRRMRRLERREDRGRLGDRGRMRLDALRGMQQQKRDFMEQRRAASPEVRNPQVEPAVLGGSGAPPAQPEMSEGLPEQPQMAPGLMRAPGLMPPAQPQRPVFKRYINAMGGQSEDGRFNRLDFLRSRQRPKYSR